MTVQLLQQFRPLYNADMSNILLNVFDYYTKSQVQISCIISQGSVTLACDPEYASGSCYYGGGYGTCDAVPDGQRFCPCLYSGITAAPSYGPSTICPTSPPSTTQPSTLRPTMSPTKSPTIAPTFPPTFLPSQVPTMIPTKYPSSQPSRQPSKHPSSLPSYQPVT